MTNVVHDLRVDKLVLAVDVHQLVAAQLVEVVVLGRLDDVMSLLVAVRVHDDVMGNARQPERELAGVGVFTFLQIGDDLNECLLEDIISNVRVVNHEQNVREELLLVSS